MSIRHDAVTKFVTCLAGGGEEVRKRVLASEDQWRWWGKKPDDILRPAAYWSRSARASRSKPARRSPELHCASASATKHHHGERPRPRKRNS